MLKDHVIHDNEKMVEVTVKVEGEGAYVAGDNLYCTLTFHNSHSEPQTLAWVGAQIHCQCLTKESLVKLKQSKEKPSTPVNDTSFFPNKGISIYSCHNMGEWLY